MKELVLGINYFGHDSAVSLVNMNGDVLYCLTEERFSNIKNMMGLFLLCLSIKLSI